MPEVVQPQWIQPPWVADSSSYIQCQPRLRIVSKVLTTLGLQRWKAGRQKRQSVKHLINKASEDRQLTKPEALKQEQCWVETFKVISWTLFELNRYQGRINCSQEHGNFYPSFCGPKSRKFTMTGLWSASLGFCGRNSYDSSERTVLNPQLTFTEDYRIITYSTVTSILYLVGNSLSMFTHMSLKLLCHCRPLVQFNIPLYQS